MFMALPRYVRMRKIYNYDKHLTLKQKNTYLATGLVITALYAFAEGNAKNRMDIKI